MPFDEIFIDAPGNEALRASFKDRGLMATPVIEEPGVGLWAGLQPAVIADMVERHGTK